MTGGLTGVLTGYSLGTHWVLTGVSLGCHWGITGESLVSHWVLTGVTGVSAGVSRLPERAPEKGPQNAAFLHSACEAKVSSRLDGSTVSTVSPVPLLGTILASIWGTFGYHLGKMLHIESDCDVTSVPLMSHKCPTDVAFPDVSLMSP